MPFGLANALACFQHFTQFVLREMLNLSCFFYIDNILIFSKTQSKHQHHVSQVLAKLQEHLLFALPEKCTFYADKVLFLGFTILAEGIRMEQNTLSTILQWPYPKNLQGLNCFLGFLNFYRKFIDGFAKVAAMLTDLKKEDVDVETGLSKAESHRAFESLKSCFKSAPLLCHLDFDNPHILYVDSSKYALLATLAQNVAGKIHPVSFLSKKWNKKELAWQVHNQELGAVMQAFIKWRAWLIDTNQPVEVMSNHSNLKYFMKNWHLSDRQTEWASYLASFNFVIQYIPGKLNPAVQISFR
jgi:hypothetical protein